MNWKCKIGFHDKISIKEGSINKRKYMIKALAKYLPSYRKMTEFESNHWAEGHIGYVFGTDYSIGSYGIFPVHNQVCIRCHKCFNNVDFEKKYIEDKAYEYVKELKEKDIKEKMAEDIYKEKCRDE